MISCPWKKGNTTAERIGFVITVIALIMLLLALITNANGQNNYEIRDHTRRIEQLEVAREDLRVQLNAVRTDLMVMRSLMESDRASHESTKNILWGIAVIVVANLALKFIKVRGVA